MQPPPPTPLAGSAPSAPATIAVADAARLDHAVGIDSVGALRRCNRRLRHHRWLGTVCTGNDAVADAARLDHAVGIDSVGALRRCNRRLRHHRWLGTVCTGNDAVADAARLDHAVGIDSVGALRRCNRRLRSPSLARHRLHRQRCGR